MTVAGDTALDAPAIDDPGYCGALTIRIADSEFQTHGTLRGRFDPIDGRYHWYGRLAADERLSLRAERRPAEVTVVTPQGASAGTMGDPDFWGRLRVAGVGRPPFAVPTLEEDA